MLKVGDKIQYTNENPFITFPIGTVMTVTDIKGVMVAVTADYKVDGVVVGSVKGVMSYDEVEKYFTIYIEEPKAKWSEWETFEYCADGMACANCQYDFLCGYLDDTIKYKYSNKKVLVKVKAEPSFLYPNGKVLRAYGSCHPEDTFDLSVGIDVALCKIEKQIAKKIIEVANDKIKSI